MKEICDNCRYCRYTFAPRIMEPYVCVCRKNNGLVKMLNGCDWFEQTEHRCGECAYFLCEGMCNLQHYDSVCVVSDGVACCEFKMREHPRGL